MSVWFKTLECLVMLWFKRFSISKVAYNLQRHLCAFNSELHSQFAIWNQKSIIWVSWKFIRIHFAVMNDCVMYFCQTKWLEYDRKKSLYWIRQSKKISYSTQRQYFVLSVRFSDTCSSQYLPCYTYFWTIRCQTE